MKGMAEPIPVLISAEDIAKRTDALAQDLSAVVTDEWTIVVLLQGAMPFAVDVMRALATHGVHPMQDSLWLESYRDARESSGRVVVRADLSRPIAGRHALILDDVFDTGRTIAFARAQLLAKGALSVSACAFIRKPASAHEPIEYYGFDAPDRYLVGYGMDDAGRYRGLAYVGVRD
jgi:hypoxanthine phosphoribosyltransferase